MLVRMLRTFTYPLGPSTSRTLPAGYVFDETDTLAEMLLHAGVAELVDPPPEVVPEEERATGLADPAPSPEPDPTPLPDPPEVVPSEEETAPPLKTAPSPPSGRRK